MIDTDNVLLEYQESIDKFKNKDGFYEQISTLLITHLYIEYFINQIVLKHFRLKTKILEDHRSYSFSIKLDLIYEKGFIPEWVYFNIRKFNKIRNEFSHNLHFDVLNSDLKFKRDDDEGMVETVDLKQELIGKGINEQRHNLIILQIPLFTLVVFSGYIKRAKL